jgi:hypothetical protein
LPLIMATCRIVWRIAITSSRGVHPAESLWPPMGRSRDPAARRSPLGPTAAGSEDLSQPGAQGVGRRRSERQAQATNLAFDLRGMRNARQVHAARGRDELNADHGAIVGVVAAAARAPAERPRPCCFFRLSSASSGCRPRVERPWSCSGLDARRLVTGPASRRARQSGPVAAAGQSGAHVPRVTQNHEG